MTDLLPPPPAQVPASPAVARPPSKARLFVVLGGIVVFLAIVLYAVKDNQSASELAIGQCFDRPTGTSVTTVVKHACTEPHDAEVFHVAAYTGGDTYPADFDGYIDGTCTPIFASYVGVPVDATADLSFGWFYPDEDAFKSGSRTFTCYVARIDRAKLTKSLKGSNGL
jgi:Septum formation